MPTEHFKSKEAYRKWTAYRHIHGIAAPNLKMAVVAGKPHKVKHSRLSRGKKSGHTESYAYNWRNHQGRQG